MKAFLADPRLKQALCLRLDNDLREGRILRIASAWDSGAGSLACSLLRHQDLGRGPSVLGLPTPLLRIVDYLCSSVYFEGEFLGAFARSLLETIRPGADLSTVPPRLANWLLADPAHGIYRLMPQAVAFANLARSYATFADDAQLARDWRRAEQEARGYSAAADYMLTKAVAETDSGGRICRLLSGWLDVHSHADLLASGWSDADETHAQATLQRLWDDTCDERENGPWPDYPALLEAADPVLAMRYVESLNQMGRVTSRYANMAVAALLGQIGATAVDDDGSVGGTR